MNVLDKWLWFGRVTAPAVKELPFASSLISTLFYTFYKYPERKNRFSRIRNFARYLTSKRRRSKIKYPTAQVLFFSDGSADSLIEPQLAIINECKKADIKSIALAPNGIYQRFDVCEIPTIALFNTSKLIYNKRWEEFWKYLTEIDSEVFLTSSKPVFIGYSLLADAIEGELYTLLSELKPKIVCLSSDQPIAASMLCYISRMLGIPTLLLQHGQIQPFNVPVRADEMIVWGDSSRELMIDFGEGKDKVIALGSPRHDRFFRSNDQIEAKNTIRKCLGLNNSPIFVFFSNGNDYIVNTEKALRTCVEWLRSANSKFGESLNILVRLHPNEDGSLYTGTGLQIFKNDLDLLTTMKAADIVGSMCSTALTEALIFTKNILQFHVDEWPMVSRNWKQGLAFRVSSEEVLNAYLSDISQSSSAILLKRPDNGDKIERVFKNYGVASKEVTNYLDNKLKIYV